MDKFTFDKTLPKNLALLLKERVQELGDAVFQYSKDKTGTYIAYSYNEVYKEILSLILILKKIGIKRADNVALISDNRREWAITDYALLSMGAVDVPRGCDSMGTEIRFIISFAECKFAFFETIHQLEKVLEKAEECPNLKTAIIFKKSHRDNPEIVNNGKIKVLYFSDILTEGKVLFSSNPKLFQNEIESQMEFINPDDTATIIFTSGTTGTPKGVMLSHRNYIAQCEVIHNFFPSTPGETWLSVLPVWHSFERVVQYFILTLKCNIAYSKPVPQVMVTDMVKIKPTWMCAVPRLWDAIEKNIIKKIKKRGNLVYSIFNFLLSPSISYANAKDKILGLVCQTTKRSRILDFILGIIPFILLWPIHKISDILIYSQIRKQLGGKIKIALSGGGALQKEVNDFYRAINFNLLEAYGLSETGPMLCIRNYKKPRPGCVGSILPSVELKIVADENGQPKNSNPLKPGKKGLILARSEHIMKGYYNRPDLTQKIIDKDGWLNTGDIGLLTFDNELKITGRAKDTIVLLGGENIEPAVLERQLLASDYIESVIVLGQDQNYLGCLIVPSKDFVNEYALKNGIPFSDYESLLKSEEIISLFSKEIHSLISVTNGFRSCERINTFVLLPNSFEIGEELSAKQEMMRPKIVLKYKNEIEKLFK